MAREFSAGGVMVRWTKSRWWVAVIEPQGRERPPGSKNEDPVVALPKGLVDPGEKPEQTAVREVHEETGATGEIIAKLKDIKYFYVRTWGDHDRVFKIVSFYLLRHRSGRVGQISADMRKEVRRALWIPLDDAPRRLEYKGEREVAKLAIEYVNTHPELHGSTESAAVDPQSTETT